MTPRLACLVALCLLLPGCAQTTTVSTESQSEIRSYSWNVSKSLGPSAVHIHVKVFPNVSCNVTMASFFRLGTGSEPSGFDALVSDDGGGWGWYQGSAAQVHSFGIDTRKVGAVPADSPGAFGGWRSHLSQTKGDIHAYLVGNLTVDAPSSEGKSIKFEYNCNGATQPDLAISHQAILANSLNMQGGMGVSLGGATATSGDQLHFDTNMPVVLVAAYLHTSHSTKIALRSPHHQVTWSVQFMQSGRPLVNYNLTDGPGGYDFTWDDMDLGKPPTTNLLTVMALPEPDPLDRHFVP